MPLNQGPWMGLRDPLPATPPAAGSVASLNRGHNFAMSFSYLIICLGLWTCLSVFVTSVPVQGTRLLSCCRCHVSCLPLSPLIRLCTFRLLRFLHEHILVFICLPGSSASWTVGSLRSRPLLSHLCGLSTWHDPRTHGVPGGGP